MMVSARRLVGALSLVGALGVTHASAQEARPEAHPGYATSPAVDAPRTVPWAEPPGPLNSFRRELDLPEPDHYSQEVLRVVQGGFGPVTVAELAVARPGEPVQVMLLHAPGGGRWKPVSRRFATMPWAQFQAFRTSVLAIATKTAEVVSRDKSDTRRIMSVCTDDGGGVVEYSSGYGGGLSLTLNGCGNADLGTFEDRLVSAATALTADHSQ
jgi:hypothetical protein